MEDFVVTKENVQGWLDSGDYMLVDLANAYVGQPLPTEDELVEFLTFLSDFAIGCKELALGPKGDTTSKDILEIAEKFDRRITLFVLGLEKMGLKAGTYKRHMTGTLVQSSLNRILRKAFGGSVYKMLELKRETEIRKQK